MKSPSRILIYRLGSLGDTVVAIPCFRAIRRLYPEAHIVTLTNAPVSEKAAPLEAVLENSKLIDGVIHYPVGLRDPKKLATLRQEIKTGRFDLAISLAASRGLLASVRDYLFFKTCGISRIVGIPYRQRDLACAQTDDGRTFEPEAKRLLRRIQGIGINAPFEMDLGLTSSELAEADDLLDGASIRSPFIAASIGSKSLLKDWGDANWKQLLDALSREFPHLALVVFGSADEDARQRELLKSWQGPHANFCGRTSPRISAGILRRARLFIGHDSGPMHLAAAVGTCCLTIYSAQARPGQWFPWGSGHLNLYPYAYFDPRRTSDLVHQQKAIASIPVDDVLAAARDCLR